MDVDDFKSVNDTRGHAAGDELLRAIAGRLNNTVSAKDMIARLGGDEFVVVVHNADSNQAKMMANRIIHSIREPYDIFGHALSRSCSIGIATSGPNSESGSILRQADLALYRAKSSGRNRYEVYDEQTMVEVDQHYRGSTHITERRSEQT